MLEPLPHEPLPSVTLVAAHYYPAYVARAWRTLRRVAQATGAADGVAVFNNPVAFDAARAMPRVDGPALELVQHDNTGFEFGAYQKGFALRRDSPAEWFVFLNDSCAVHQVLSQPLVDNLANGIRAIGRSSLPVVVGRVVDMSRSYRIGSGRSHRWVTSNLFAVNRAALQVLEGTIHLDAADRLIDGGATPDTFFSPQLDPVLRERIAGWLLMQGAGERWYKAAPLTAANAAGFAAKARSILQEKALSLRLDAAGAMFYDMNWMTRGQRLRHGVAELLFTKQTM